MKPAHIAADKNEVTQEGAAFQATRQQNGGSHTDTQPKLAPDATATADFARERAAFQAMIMGFIQTAKQELREEVGATMYASFGHVQAMTIGFIQAVTDDHCRATHAIFNNGFRWLPHHMMSLWAMHKGEIDADTRMLLKQALATGEELKLVLKQARGDAKKKLALWNDAIADATAERKSAENKASSLQQALSDAELLKQVRADLAESRSKNEELVTLVNKSLVVVESAQKEAALERKCPHELAAKFEKALGAMETSRNDDALDRMCMNDMAVKMDKALVAVEAARKEAENERKRTQDELVKTEQVLAESERKRNEAEKERTRQEQQTDAKFASLQKDVRDLITAVRDVKSNVAGLKNDGAAVNTDVVEVKNNVGAIKTDIEEVKSNVAVIKSGVREVKNEVSCLRNKMSPVDKVLCFGNTCRKGIAHGICRAFRVITRQGN